MIERLKDSDDDLAAALSRWVSQIASKIDDPDQGAALSVALLMPGAELCITARLRRGDLTLEAIDPFGRCTELHHERVLALRLASPISTLLPS